MDWICWIIHRFLLWCCFSASGQSQRRPLQVAAGRVPVGSRRFSQRSQAALSASLPNWLSPSSVLRRALEMLVSWSPHQDQNPHGLGGVEGGNLTPESEDQSRATGRNCRVPYGVTPCGLLVAPSS